MAEAVELTMPGVWRIVPACITDARGHFCETWNRREFEAATGLVVDWVQENSAFSAKAATVRGLHYQAPPHAQAKLVRCTRGRVRDIVVDARVGSPTFGHWLAEELDPENRRQIFVPAGCLHGYATLEASSEVVYRCTAHYVPEAEGAVRFDDPSLSIDWGVDVRAVVASERDARAPAFEDWVSPFRYSDAVGAST